MLRLPVFPDHRESNHLSVFLSVCPVTPQLHRALECGEPHHAMTRSAEQAIDEAQVRLGEASARMGDEHPNFVACLAGVLTFATCGVAWIATCFIWGDAAPGVKIECEPCGGTGFVVRKRRIFVPSNQGMERPQRSIWGPYGT